MSKHEFVVPGYEHAKPEEQKKALQRIFRHVFTTDEGKFVLNVLLSDLRYFRQAENESDHVLCDYAKQLLRERLGIENTEVITASLIDAIKEK